MILILLKLILQYGDKGVFATVRVACQILLVIKVSVGNNEKLFGIRKLIVTYLILTMGD